MRKVLVLGGGYTVGKRLDPVKLTFYNAAEYDSSGKKLEEVDTIDFDHECKPTCVWDLNVHPWPVIATRGSGRYEYDEVHAYEVLEHLGRQGDVHEFFRCFAEIWGVLKPGGLLFASCPSYKSLWAFGDPGHTRIINSGSLVFLFRKEYDRQRGKTGMSQSYRQLLVGDWELVNHNDDGESYRFVLRAK